MDRLSIIFMGSGEFACDALLALLEKPELYQICGVYSQPARPQGRKKQPRPTPVATLAQQHGLPLFTPEKLDNAAFETFKTLEPDLLIVASYGLLVPASFLDLPRSGAINIHGSLLPRWRGASPVQQAIVAGDPESGITYMQMTPGLDDGPILSQYKLPIEAGWNAGTLFADLAQLGAKYLSTTVMDYVQGHLSPIPQQADSVTWAPRLTREDGVINFHEDAAAIIRKMRGFDPWPGVRFLWKDEWIKLLEADDISDDSASSLCSDSGSGTILSTDPACVACAKGSLLIKKVQRPGRKPGTGAEFLNGCRLRVGDRIS